MNNNQRFLDSPPPVHVLLRRRRKELALLQTQLAETLHVSRNALPSGNAAAAGWNCRNSPELPPLSKWMPGNYAPKRWPNSILSSMRFSSAPMPWPTRLPAPQ